MILYGISNCDTIKKAKQWLSENMVAYQFHDFRKDGLEADQLNIWIDAAGLGSVFKQTWNNLA